jgi:hypothetical protein
MVATCAIADLLLYNLNQPKYGYNRWRGGDLGILSSYSKSPQNLSPDGIQTVICNVTLGQL